ncbi:hypothetical protein [Vibrio metschnikovii]|uniref:hypothetical protein n=1 Tax=Vibrio metschnikovii TaxID=28172 RepID=UPI001C300828|nr:hypothetical protein [Vibrio metschnikovii]
MNYLLLVAEEMGLVKDNPRLQIIVSHSFIEMMVKSLVDHHFPENQMKNHSRRLEKLRKENIIDGFQFKLYQWYKDLRNVAVHTPLFRLHNDHFEPLIGVVKQTELNIDSFHRFSMSLIAELWNKNLDVLGPEYLPDIG